MTLPLQNVATIYSRIKTFAPYFEDTFKLTPSLRLSYGLRWDYSRRCMRNSITSAS